jgi:hypothetical protein
MFFRPENKRSNPEASGIERKQAALFLPEEKKRQVDA